MCLVQGEIDFLTAAAFRRAALDALDKDGPALTIDLSLVTFMDCAGVNVLVFVRREAIARGGHVSLSGQPKMISRLLRLVGLDAAFGIQELEPLISLPA